MISVVSSEIDDRIIRALVRNGRASYAQIAQEVSLSAHAVAERVRRLEARGVIRGYTALIDQRELGRGLYAYIDVRLAPTTETDAFERLAHSLPATRGPRPDGARAPQPRGRGRDRDPDRDALHRSAALTAAVYARPRDASAH